jgi:hypothetical protein
MPEKIQGVCSASQFDNAVYDSSATTVRLGEANLSEVARSRGVDPSALLAENPQISSLYTPLLIGQEIHLPICQTPEEQSRSVPAGQSCSDQSPGKVPAQTSSGDPLAKSVVQASFKNKPELPPDEANVKAALGDDGLRTYREVKSEFINARRIYQQTGKVPPLKHHAPIEIIAGKWMTRSERYDLNLIHQGKSPAYPKRDADVDPTYLTHEEFGDEWLARAKKEMEACSETYTKPDKKDQCGVEVKEKYMGKDYMEASWAATAAGWNEGAYIENIKNSGPLGLGGRVVGRSVGYAIAGDQGADEGEAWGGLVGGIGDVAVAVKSGANARSRLNEYEGSAGLEVRREAPMEVANATRPVTTDTQPDTPATSKTVAETPDEPLVLSHGTDNPGFQQMGGLGPGRIRVDHSPGARQDFGQGFYVAVGEGRGGIGNAEAFGDLRVAQRGSGPRQVLAWQVKRSDLGEVVDVRPGGEHAGAWKKYLEQPLAPGVKMTIGDYIRGTGVEKRGEYFEKFLESIGKQKADVVIGPIGTPETAGVVTQPGTQMAVRSQRVADRLNSIMAGTPGPAAPAGNTP